MILIYTGHVFVYVSFNKFIPFSCSIFAGLLKKFMCDTSAPVSGSDVKTVYSFYFSVCFIFWIVCYTTITAFVIGITPTYNFPVIIREITVHYTGTDAQVLADELLGDVFCNLINNSRKFGGPEVEIWISVDDRDDEVEIAFADNGPGIPDSVKQSLFSEHDFTITPASRKGLGLHVVQSIVEWYGGNIRVENRVKGRPEEGVAIIFTLKRQ